MDSIDERPAFTFNTFMSTSQLSDFLNAFDGFEAEWEAQGFSVLSQSAVNDRLLGRRAFPEGWQTSGPTNSAFGPPHFLQFLIFLKEPGTTAALEVFLGGILHAALGRFHKLFADHSDKDKNIKLPVKFCPSLWFEQEEVLVTIVVDLETPADYKVAESQIPEGFKRAAQWMERHGVTHPYLTYYIRNGKLDAKPTLSMQPLEEAGR